MRRNGLILALVLVVAVMAFPLTAQAVLTLNLDDGAGHTASIVDNGAGDTDLTVGIIHTASLVLGNWTSSITAGYSKPAIGDASHASMDTLTGSVSSSAGGVLTITLADTDFSLPLNNNSATMEIGGTTQGSVMYAGLYNGSIFNTMGAFSGGAFSGTSVTPLTTTNPFSLAQQFTITHGTGANLITTFDAKLTVVPIPPTALLMGTGLLGLVGLGWRRRRKS